MVGAEGPQQSDSEGWRACAELARLLAQRYDQSGRSHRGCDRPQGLVARWRDTLAGEHWGKLLAEVPDRADRAAVARDENAARCQQGR